MLASIRARTTVVATGAVALALAAALVLVTLLVRANLTASAHAQAEGALHAVAEQLAAGDAPSLVADGTTTVTISGPGRTAQVVPPPTEGSVVLVQRVPTDRGTYIVSSQTSLEAAESALSTLAWSWAGIGLLLLAVVAGTTRLAVHGALRPIERIRAEFADISAHDLHRRVPLPHTRDEVHQLAVTMNATLDRLQHAVGRHQQFVADASHELRGPLAALRTELELAVDHPDRTDWERAAQDALADTRRVERLTDDLLFLARMDADEPTRSTDVDLAAALTELARRTHAVRLDVPGEPVHVTGSAPHLDRLLANLVRNALRHRREHVDLHLSVTGAVVVVQVDDDGNGIAREDRAQVFERFTRLDEARGRDGGGAGLGLAIASDIARRHEGTLDVGDAPTGGARFTLRLPVSGAAPESAPLPVRVRDAT